MIANRRKPAPLTNFLSDRCELQVLFGVCVAVVDHHGC